MFDRRIGLFPFHNSSSTSHAFSSTALASVSSNTSILLKVSYLRLNAGLDAPGENFGGSWEDPSCEVRGQFMGHWLSGTAMLARNTGELTRSSCCSPG